MKPLFNKYDKVKRIDIDRPYIYTVVDIHTTENDYYYTIVRHPTPTKPHWTILNEKDLVLHEEIKNAS